MLVIPGGFVPFNDTVTLLTYKRIKHLNLNLDVLAMNGPIDSGIEKELLNDPDYQRMNIEYYKNYDDVITIKKPYKLLTGIINMLLFIKKSIKKFEAGQYDYLYTSSIPGITHICGKKIKERNKNVVWYASFSDPIKNSPYKNDPHLRKRSIFYRIAFKIGSFIYMNDKYEEAAIKYADYLIFICEEQRDFTISQYSNVEELKKKSIILPLCYLKEWKIYNDLLENQQEKNKVKQAVHLGRLYGLRKMDTFLQAIKELKEEDAKLSEKIIFNQYWEIQKEDLDFIKKNNLEDVIKIHEKVDYNTSLEIMKKADILVLFDTIVEDNAIQPYMPSKILEYLLLRKDILGICKKNSPSFKLLSKYGFSSIGYEVKEIKENIKAIISNNYNHIFSVDSLEEECNQLRI